MRTRLIGAGVLLGSLMVGGTMGQQRAGNTGGNISGAAANGSGNSGNAMDGAVAREVKGLTAEDFAERQAALKRLEGLIAEQLKQRAAVQEIVDGLMKDLAKQEQALAMVTDIEAQAQVAGLLEMERGMAGWTIQTMAEPVERRNELLAWGLGQEVHRWWPRPIHGKRPCGWRECDSWGSWSRTAQLDAVAADQ